MDDDGKYLTIDYKAYRDPGDGSWKINPFERLSGAGIAPDAKEDFQDIAFDMARRVYEREGRIRKGEPFFRVVGEIRISPNAEEDNA